MFEALTNWGRWGADDERGALNLLTDARRAAAARPGADRASRSASPTTSPPSRCPSTPTRSSTTCWRRATPATPTGSRATRRPGTTWRSTSTACGPPTSTPSPTCSSAAEMYGGRPASEVRSDGARSNTVLSMADGVIGRGVLLDVAPGPRLATTSTTARWSPWPTSRRPRPPRACRVGPGDILLVAWGREPRRRPTPRVRRVLRPARRVPPVAGRARGGRARQRRDLRPDALRRHPRVAVPGPPDRDRGHGPPPDRQRPPGAAGGAVRRARPVGVPVHHGAAPDPKGTGCPVNPVAVL